MLSALCFAQYVPVCLCVCNWYCGVCGLDVCDVAVDGPRRAAANVGQ